MSSSVQLAFVEAVGARWAAHAFLLLFPMEYTPGTPFRMTVKPLKVNGKFLFNGHGSDCLIFEGFAAFPLPSSNDPFAVDQRRQRVLNVRLAELGSLHQPDDVECAALG